MLDLAQFRTGMGRAPRASTGLDRLRHAASMGAAPKCKLSSARRTLQVVRLPITHCCLSTAEVPTADGQTKHARTTLTPLSPSPVHSPPPPPPCLTPLCSGRNARRLTQRSSFGCAEAQAEQPEHDAPSMMRGTELRAAFRYCSDMLHQPPYARLHCVLPAQMIRPDICCSEFT